MTFRELVVPPTITCCAAIALGAITPITLVGQIEVGANIQVSATRGDLPHGEVLIAADPSDKSRLIACSMYFLTELNTWQTVVYSSNDGGVRWLPTLDMREFFPWSVDPACTLSGEGTGYFVSISSAGYLADESYLPVFRSADGGHTWTQTVVIPNTHQRLDREYLVTDDTGGEFHGRIYMNGAGFMRDMADGRVGDVSLFRSSDQGMNFLGPVKRGSLDRRFPLGPVAPTNGVILSTGDLVLAFGETRGDWTEDGRLRLPPNVRGDPIGLLKVLVSKDGGHSFLPAVTVDDWYMKVGSWSARNHASLAVDPGSAEFKDRLYLVWTDVRSGRLEILLSHSADGGRSWSPPRVVSDHGSNFTNQGPDHFMPLVAVNHRGVVGVAWYDRRDSEDNIGWTVRFSASLDGGETFLPSIPVSSDPNVYDADTEWPMLATARRKGRDEHSALSLDLQLSFFHYNGGDTAGMAADAEGVFHLIWVDNRTGMPQIWTAPVRVAGAAVRNGSPELAVLRDVSADVKLRLSNPRVDRSTMEISVDARLENTSSGSMAVPLTMRVLDLSSEVGSARILGADNFIEHAGAIWLFEAADDLLAAGQQSSPRTLRFSLEETRPLTRGTELKLGLLHLDFRVLSDDRRDNPVETGRALTPER